MIVRSSLRQKLTTSWHQSGDRVIPLIITILILFAIFLIYAYSIAHNQLFLGQHYDYSARLAIAMEYARDPSKIFKLEQWLDVWPPIPFIIQGFVLRLALFPGMTDASTGIMTVQLTSVFLVLLGFYFISRSVALQTDEFTGLIAFLTCFCANILLHIAHTTASEVYTFFFVSLAIWSFFRLITKNKGLGWLVLSFALAFFCRSESLILAFLLGALLVAKHYWWSAALLMGTQSALVLGKFFGAILLVDGTKFFELGKLYVSDNKTWLDRLKNALSFPYYLLKFNQELIIILFCICIFLLIYNVAKPVKYRNFFKAAQVKNDWNSASKSLAAISKRAGSIVWFTRTYRQVCSWIVSVPVVFWTALFLASIGPLIGEALRGNINGQWRYLFMTNVFVAVIIALLTVQSIRTLSARGGKLAKKAAFGIVSVVVLLSLWSGLAHATGQKTPKKMLPSEQEVIHFIRDHRVKGDWVAFDPLPKSNHLHFAAYLLDPSLPVSTQIGLASIVVPQERDPELASLLPDKFQFNKPPSTGEGRTTLYHALIHSKNPRFLVLASDQKYEFLHMKEHKLPSSRLGQSSNIQKYLSPVEGPESTLVFQSPYVLPEVKIPFAKIHENKDFIILERLRRPF